MEIKIAKACGFCFGVRRAIQIAEDSVKEADRAYTLGPIIHNPQLVNALKAKGVAPVDTMDDLKRGETLIIRSHGVGPSYYEQAESQGLEVLDATCPHVRKAQLDAKKIIEKGYDLVILGEKKHPEVISIASWAGDKGIVIETIEEAKVLPHYTLLGVVVQTTFEAKELERIKEVLETKADTLEMHATICTATHERQDSAIQLAQESDMMIVVGGKNSANTTRLAQVCRKQGCPTYHIETAKELDSAWFAGKEKIGITAGASTPDWIIQEVVSKMETMETNVEVMSEELIDQFDFETDLKKGDIVEGTVVSVNHDAAFLDIGYKTEAILPKKEIAVPAPESASDVISVGQEMKVEIANTIKEDGAVVVSLVKMKKAQDWVDAEEAFENKTVIECEGKEANKAGLVVAYKSLRGFIPFSQADVRFVKNVDYLVGQTIRAVIIDLNSRKNRLVMSRKAVLQEELAEKQAAALEKMETGAVLEGTVAKIMPYGAFIDLGGVEGLLHISDISWKKVDTVDRVLAVGQEVKVLVQNYDQESGKISLSMKALQQDPWVEAVEKYEVGQVVEGKVTKLLPYGAILSFDPELQGLLHISEVTKQRNAKVEDLLAVGDTKAVKIIKIDMEKKKISLSMTAIEEDKERAEVENYLNSEQNETAAETIGEAVK